MAWNSAGGVNIDDYMAERRRRVAAFRLRGLTQREIAQALAGSGFVNPKTGKAYNVAQINRDLKAIRAEWRAEMLADMDEHIAAMLAEIREVRRRAWREGELETVLRGLKQERDLLGLDAPKRVDVRMEIIEKARRFAEQWNLDVDEVVAEAERILSEAR